MTFPLLNKPYKFVFGGYNYRVIFREDKGDYFTYDSELTSPSQRDYSLNKWDKRELKKIEHKFIPLFRTPIESDPEYEGLFI